MSKIKYAFIAFYFIVSACSNETSTDSSDHSNSTTNKKENKDIVFTCKSEDVVEPGEIFQLTYEVNESIDQFTPPDFKNFDVLSGPAVSSFSSTQIINGKSTAEISTTYTYNISCSNTGDFTIPPAEVTVNGLTYKSNPVTIKVLGSKTGNQNTNSNVTNKQSSKDEIFIANEYSKTNVYKGEWIIATTKIYTKVDFQNISEVKFPDYNGFWTETLQAPRQIEFKNELYNGEMYNSAVLKQTLLFAQNPGKYTISPYEIELQLKKKDGKGEDFFGNTVDTYKLVNKKLSTGSRTIIVKPLPQPAPDRFSGITGKNFTINAEIDPLHIKTDESANLKLTVAGSGNLYLLNELPLNLPKGLETFKPELEKKNKASENGPFDEHIFNYILIGNTPGEYVLPPFEFIYFNPDKQDYVTVSSGVGKMTVGEGNAYVESSDNNKTTENRDIRFIKENKPSFKVKGKQYFGMPYYYLTFFFLSLCFMILLYIRRKQIEKNADAVNNKKKSAGKVSIKRLKLAYEKLQQGNKQEFYKEILTAVWNYLSDKITISKEQLTMQHIDKILKEKGISDEIRARLSGVIDVCGYAQYSPVGEEAQPQNIYNETLEVLNELEKNL